MLQLIRSRRALVLDPSIAAQIVAIALMLVAIPLRGATADDVGLVLPEGPLSVYESTENTSSLTTFRVKLAAEPSETITVSVTSSRTRKFTISPTSLTFTTTDWDVEQEMTMSAEVLNANVVYKEPITLTFKGAGVITGTLTVTVNTGGITFRELTECEWIEAHGPNPHGGPAFCVTEGEAETYDVALSAAPSGTVTVSVESGDTGAAMVSPASLTFTPQNWNRAQQVSITGVHDDDTNNEEVEVRFTGGLSKTITIGVEDDDQRSAVGDVAVLAFDAPAGHRLVTGPVPGVLYPPEYRTFQTPPVEVRFVPSLTSGESATICLQGDGELAHHGGDWRILPTQHKTVGGVTFACSEVTSTSPFAVLENTPPSIWFVDGAEQRAVAGATFMLRTYYSDAQTAARELTFSWTQTGGPEVELASADFPQVDFLVPADAVGETLSFRATVTDGGGLTGSAEATVTVAAPDLRPDDFGGAFAPETLNPQAHAYSGTAQMSGFDLPVPISVTASPADASFAYYVGEDEDDAATEVAPGDELYLWARAGETPGDTVTVTVVVGTGADAVSAAWTVTTAGASVSPATPPTAEAGTDLTGKRGGEVTLSGSGSKHAGGSQAALSYSWRIKGASHAELLAGTSWLKNATSATATYSVPRRKDITDRRALDDGQTIDFELTVTDGDGETDTDTVRVTVQGSTWKVVSLSVADASAEESSGEIAFAVSLSAASRDEVTVAYATTDGTALAGSDYTAAAGTLTFQPGDTSKTVTVALLDDVHDEGRETLTLTLSGPAPARTVSLARATATGTITNSDPLQRDWLARFGRAAAADAIAAVTARLETPPSAGSHLTVGGHRLPLDGSGDAGASSHLLPVLTGDAEGADRLTWSDDPAGGTSRAMSTRELLMGTSFRAVLGNGAGSQWTGWGQGASVSRFSGGSPGLSLSGETATGSMGMDYARGRLLAGFALTHSLGAGTAHGLAGRTYAMGSTVTAMLPYARVALSERISAWGMAGTGTGRLTLDLDGSAAERYGADLAMSLAAVGMKGDLVTPAEAGGFALAFRADAFRVRTESAAVSTPGVGNLAGARADASRLRAMLDGSRTFVLADGGTVTPSLSLGVRHDGGDAETGTGLDLGAGLGWADPSRGLDLALRVHGLAAHAEDDYADWGVTGSLRLASGAAGRGLSMTLTPSYGADPGSSERLWLLPDASNLAANGDAAHPQARLDAELGYGLAVSGGLTGTPHVGFGLSETAREVRLGWRLNPAGGGGFAFTLDAARREVVNDPGPGSGTGSPEHRVGFGITARR